MGAGYRQPLRRPYRLFDRIAFNGPGMLALPYRIGGDVHTYTRSEGDRPSRGPVCFPSASPSIFGKRRFELLQLFQSFIAKRHTIPMAVVAGVVFFAVRALLALIPQLTVGFPIITYLLLHYVFFEIPCRTSGLKKPLIHGALAIAWP
jgi:hypothetical protein